MAGKELRINEQIRVKEVRLVDAEGGQEVVTTTRALELAKERGLDLVEMAANAKPPVCKILDYGKYRFEQEKKLRESKKKQKLIKLKEVRMQPKIEKHDLEFKTKHISDFLEDGNKVKVTIRFRGRELAHTDRGKDVLAKVMELLGDENFNLDKNPSMEGRFMSMIISPKGKK
ncbi:translation initiation factor IF-3 [Spirochaeta cellobiosiphila]|uniref:translation initiation factor IF-3 n=1 Tax=Spirochaeta cellobiosiphila TaxID=504483 RepID=UPI000405ADEA|nr:translation initiation factor IF-3 [Spirochaeta cellobiosiphila]